MVARRLGTNCAVHTHRSYVPVERHHVWPLGEGGPDTKENRVEVCANGHELIHHYLRELARYHGMPPWLVRIRFGRKVRRLAELGYDRIMRQEM